MATISAVNSTIQPLAASATFTGTAENALSFPSLVITIKTDADGTLNIDWSPDGTNWDRTVSFTVQNATSELQRVSVINAFFRVRYVNGSTAQSYFRLQTLLTDAPQPVTALNATTVQPDTGSTISRSAILTQPFLQNVRGNISAGLYTFDNRLIAGSYFKDQLDTNYYTSTVANNGTNVVASGALRCRTGTTANGSAIVNTKRYGRFVPGRANAFSCAVNLTDTGVTNNVREWGVGTDTDRIVFRLSGGSFSCVVRRDGTDVVDVSTTSWNSNRTAPTLTTMNLYEIHYNALFVYWIINGVVVHVYSLMGSAQTTGLVTFLSLPIRISNVNSAGATTDSSIYVAACSILGGASTEPIPVYKNITTATTTVCKIGTGDLHQLMLNTAANGTVKLYDGTSAINQFASITVSASDVPTTWDFGGLQFNNGLTIVTSAATDITVVYE